LGWYNYGARFYDAVLGRFTGVDDLADISSNKTPYHYTSNNPVNRIDPLGLTDFKVNKETGEIAQVGEKKDEPDRILKTNKDGDIK
jgi:uncharacterized protein RhaS with RHS repeats